MAGRRQSDITPDRLVDYFVICGLDECEGLEAAQVSGRFMFTLFFSHNAMVDYKVI